MHILVRGQGELEKTVPGAQYYYVQAAAGGVP